MAAQAFESFTVTIRRGPGLPLEQDQLHTALVLGLGHMQALEQLAGVNLERDPITVEWAGGCDPYMPPGDPDETVAEALEAEAELRGRLTAPARLSYFAGTGAGDG